MKFREKDTRAESTNGSDHTNKGMGLASSLSMYYVLMLLLISIPLIIFFLVLFLRVVFEYRFYILAGGAGFMVLGGFLLYRFRGRFKKRILKESIDVMEAVRSAAGDGQTVHISILGGLMNVTYDGADTGHRALDWNEPSKALPAPLNGEHRGASSARSAEILEHDPSLSKELESLRQLKERGLLTTGEYESAKKRLLGEKTI